MKKKKMNKKEWKADDECIINAGPRKDVKNKFFFSTHIRRLEDDDSLVTILYMMMMMWSPFATKQSIISLLIILSLEHKTWNTFSTFN